MILVENLRDRGANSVGYVLAGMDMSKMCKGYRYQDKYHRYYWEKYEEIMSEQGHNATSKRGYLVIKRAIDIIGSAAALALFSPLMLITAICIKVESKGPVLFKQKRIGKNRNEFYILKFRSMKTDAPKEVPTHLLYDPDTHTTRVGKFIRKTSIDELPQLINVVKGEMSLVGPRPALWNQFDLIRERDKYGANDLLPGITGLAQVNGRDELSIEEKAHIDGQYTCGLNLYMDIRILVVTAVHIISGTNIVEGNKKTIKRQI